ncbi:proton pump-interactor 1-like [Dorcoceras hygrometricum]|uniref:Proton pump-interactor 1-like n=1 Tax=Dorcoceras hygrometricum TaxID=472368 RepID=A0A2Z7BN50_9LAMI|nr:proton pump-interactor 1-like [Dorcoceras hygrometricum]
MIDNVSFDQNTLLYSNHRGEIAFQLQHQSLYLPDSKVAAEEEENLIDAFNSEERELRFNVASTGLSYMTCRTLSFFDLKIEVARYHNDRGILIKLLPLTCQCTMPKAYVVFVGREPGVYEKWCEAIKQVCDFRGACYKGYESIKEAEEAFCSFLQEPDATRFREKCGLAKTETASTSRPYRPKNAQKLVKVLRDLAVEIHNHAVRMAKVVEEIGEILDDMQVTKVNNADGEKKCGASAPIVIDISDDSSG